MKRNDWIPYEELNIGEVEDLADAVLHGKDHA